MMCPDIIGCEEVYRLKQSVAKLANAVADLLEENKKLRDMLEVASEEIKKLRVELAEAIDYDPTQDSGTKPCV